MKYKDTHIIFKPYFIIFIFFVLFLILFSLILIQNPMKKPVYYDKSGLPLNDFVLEGKAVYLRYEPNYYFDYKLLTLTFTALLSGLLLIGTEIKEV